MDSSISDDSSRFKRKLTFFITQIIILILIITAITSSFFIIKNQIDSQSLSSYPTKAIEDVCYLTHPFLSHNPDIYEISEFRSVHLCIDSISLLHLNSPFKTNPSKIFAFSLLAAINQLTETISSTKDLLPDFKNEPAVTNCSDSFADSLIHLRRSLTKIGDDPDENLLRNKEIVGDVKKLMNIAESDVEACLDLFKDDKGSEKMGVHQVRLNANMAKAYVRNSLVILEKIDYIFHMFNTRIKSVLGSLLFDSYFTLGVFCCQFFLLAAIFGRLLNLYLR